MKYEECHPICVLIPDTGIKIQNIKISPLIKVQAFGYQREKPELLTTKMFGGSVMLCQALLFLFCNTVCLILLIYDSS